MKEIKPISDVIVTDVDEFHLELMKLSQKINEVNRNLEKCIKRSE